MSRTIDNQLRQVFRHWEEEPPLDAWDTIAHTRMQKAADMKAGETDDTLRQVFDDWGTDAPRNAWAGITHERTSRNNEKKKKRRRMALVFFAGSLFMALLLCPFILCRSSLTSQRPY